MREILCSDMTLRDWFAGQALGGAVFGANVYEYEAVARHCFIIADAMIVERNKEGGAGGGAPAFRIGPKEGAND
jgi:hypothetical protein